MLPGGKRKAFTSLSRTKNELNSSAFEKKGRDKFQALADRNFFALALTLIFFMYLMKNSWKNPINLFLGLLEESIKIWSHKGESLNETFLDMKKTLYKEESLRRKKASMIIENLMSFKFIPSRHRD